MAFVVGSRTSTAQRVNLVLSLLLLLFLSFADTKPIRSLEVCQNPILDPFDHTVRDSETVLTQVCKNVDSSKVLLSATSSARVEDDYTCSPSRPCKNGACCEKSTLVCKFGPDACGTNGQSPNEKCWSHCDAHAECGRYAKVAGTKCPLNVCCSKHGFCGMKPDFCKDECQSNCNQPGSGSSGSDAQKRIIGYYEGWKHDQACAGMGFDDIPVNALTHLYFAFGYISPGDFAVVPMDNLDSKLFADFTALKAKNQAVKYVVALGGWTFNDNSTATQPVFHDIVSSPANRATFISNLIKFFKFYGFDGVDFDWEYPGAPDRGGHPEDGVNFTRFLKELRQALNKAGDYVVSFTIPTSYWYLRHFDLAAIEHVDFVNVMSYDLHGVWDGDNPIGNHVWAHTNLTEMNEAMDLLWRNNVPPAKLNLGIGFYGRSFELDTPGCDSPGCGFTSGGSAGPCSGQSGVLSFREIKDIIKEKNLTPYHDKASAAKYIVWDQKQWVSYDDEDTIQAKIKFANSLGLGGLLIWSIDQDDDQLTALNAVLKPKSVSVSSKSTEWDDLATKDCYVTNCGEKCDNAKGFITLEKQPCGNAKKITRHSDAKDSELCCPLSAMPDKKKCTWRGNAPSCNGRCHDGEVMLQMNRWGSGKYCEDGNKAYCCETPEAKDNKCRWTGMGGDCDKNEIPFTFSGTFLSTIADISSLALLTGDLLSEAIHGLDMDARKIYCCPKSYTKEWKNCKWYGEPGSCFDNHCPAGHQVQMTDSPYGLGQSCFPRLERNRVFCCEPKKTKSKFLPVPLANLFPDPPKGDDIHTDHQLKIDKTRGHSSTSSGPADNPNDSSFGFYVMASPEEIQTTLRTIDGSHWEVFNCRDAISEERQTVQMICTDTSENSNCGKISLGDGVPGTILEMPQGCGPGNYAVAHSMRPSSNQSLPGHLRKRNIEDPMVYDLTFDYEWARVPQDKYGKTQLRVDFSNEEGYWDNIVAATANPKNKKKRSLEDVQGNHKRWLEEEWREDFHGPDRVSHEHLHKRWFGKTVVDWLNSFFKGGIKVDKSNKFREEFTAIILHEKWECQLEHGRLDAILDVRASAKVDIDTTFGMTIITTLSLPLKLDNSYLYFKNKGEVTAIFKMDAKGRATFDTKDFQLANIPIPGAGFRIPKILTVGPTFRLYASANGELNVAGKFEARVAVAKWDIYQTYPIESQKFTPQPAKDNQITGGANSQGLQKPEFDYSIKAYGSIEAHLKPALTFGIEIDPYWDVKGNAKVELLVDSYVRLEASAEKSTRPDSCPFSYGIYAGANLIARAEAPERFKWNPKTFELSSTGKVPIYEGGTCPKSQYISELPELAVAESNHSSWSEKRSQTWGPIFRLPKTKQLCPDQKGKKTKPSKCSEIPIMDDIADNSIDDFARYVLQNDSLVVRNVNDASIAHDRKKGRACDNILQSETFDVSGQMKNRRPNLASYRPAGKESEDSCTAFELLPIKASEVESTPNFATEHILEWQLILHFFDKPDVFQHCDYIQRVWAVVPAFKISGHYDKWALTPFAWLGAMYPSNVENVDEFMLLAKGINGRKENIWAGHDPIDLKALGKCVKGAVGCGKRKADTNDDDLEWIFRKTAVKNVRNLILAVKYMKIKEVNDILIKQANRVTDMFEDLETIHIPPLWSAYKKDKTALQNDPDYQYIGMKALWIDYLKKEGAANAVRVKTIFPKIMPLFTAEVERLAAIRNKPTPPLDEEEDEKDFRESVDKLQVAIDSMIASPWTNPFATYRD